MNSYSGYSVMSTVVHWYIV